MTDKPTAASDAQDDDHRLSRRRTLAAMGIAGFAGLSAPAAADPGASEGRQATAEVGVLANPAFITDATGGTPPFAPDTELFDPGPVSIPLDDVLADDAEYDAALFPSLNDGRHQVVRPPSGYDGGGYGDPWEPVTWGEYGAVTGRATVGGVRTGGEETGTRVNIEVQDGLPKGQYTVWVVKFAALADDSDLGPDDPFVTPAGNGLVGFHNLGGKFGDAGDSENDFRVDGDGDGGIHVFQEGGPLTGIPGFREPGYPFVGTADDYEQDVERLVRVADDLREEDEIHFVGAFHYDDQTWGVYPGPWHVNQFSAVFRF